MVRKNYSNITENETLAETKLKKLIEHLEKKLKERNQDKEQLNQKLQAAKTMLAEYQVAYTLFESSLAWRWREDGYQVFADALEAGCWGELFDDD